MGLIYEDFVARCVRHQAALEKEALACRNSEDGRISIMQLTLANLTQDDF